MMVMHMVTASEIMIRDIQTVAPDAALSTALAVMRSQDIRHLVVMKDDDLAGVLSNRDYRRVLERTGPDGSIHGVDTIRVSEIMTPARAVITVRPDTPVLDIAELMVTRKVGCILVVDEQHRLVGLLTQTDVMRALTSARGPRPLPSQ
jgi:CBS domain-containing protein